MQDKNRRRFQRVQIPFGEVFSILGARVAWPNNEMSEILDISYKGLAVRRPGVFKIKDKDVIKILVSMGNEPAYDCFARVVWLNQELIGLEITSLPPAGHLALRKFLDDALLGLSLRRVDKEHFATDSTFSYWYQAGSACHVFIWVSQSVVLERVQFDLDGTKVELKRGTKIDPADVDVVRALRVLSQLQDSAIAVNTFIKSLGR